MQRHAHRRKLVCDGKTVCLMASLDLINEFYTILCLVAVYIVYQFMLLVNIISHDYDAELIALDEYLSRLINYFNPHSHPRSNE